MRRTVSSLQKRPVLPNDLLHLSLPPSVGIRWTRYRYGREQSTGWSGTRCIPLLLLYLSMLGRCFIQSIIRSHASFHCSIGWMVAPIRSNKIPSAIQSPIGAILLFVGGLSYKPWNPNHENGEHIPLRLSSETPASETRSPKVHQALPT